MNSFTQLKTLKCDFISENQYSSLRIFSYLKNTPPVAEKLCSRKWYIGGTRLKRCRARRVGQIVKSFYVIFFKPWIFLRKCRLVILRKIPMEGIPPLLSTYHVLLIGPHKHNQSLLQLLKNFFKSL